MPKFYDSKNSNSQSSRKNKFASRKIISVIQQNNSNERKVPATPPSSPVNQQHQPDLLDKGAAELKLTSKERKKLKRVKWTEQLQSKMSSTSSGFIVGSSLNLQKSSYSLLKKRKSKSSRIIELNSMKNVIGELFDDNGQIKMDHSPNMNHLNENIKHTQKPRTDKGKRKAAVGEIIRLQQVLQHQPFKSNPLAAIQLHAKNTFQSPVNRQ